MGDTLTMDMLLSVLVVIAVITAIVAFLYWILSNPFSYPYFDWKFDVSRKRNVNVANYIDEFLRSESNWMILVQHQCEIERWKGKSEARANRSILRPLRRKQYLSVLDDEHAFRFTTVRNQTRYRQRNYVKTSYVVSVGDTVTPVSWEWLVQRRDLLAEIGFETTLSDYHARNQRRLMTRTLREQIMKRDNYTCQICGKYMPDEVGLHIDHIVPVAKGGKSVPSNLQVLCSKCNGRKGTKAR